MIDTWQQGKTPFGGTEWTVSMENEATISDGGFLLKAESRTSASQTAESRNGAGETPNIQQSNVGLASTSNIQSRLAELEALGQTPDDFEALGWIYVPWAVAPEDLRSCLDAGGMIAVARNFLQGSGAGAPGVTTLFLNGGLNGKLFYFGVALTPLARESHARVGRVMASCGRTTDYGLPTSDDGGQAMAALGAVGDAVTGFCEKISKKS